MGFDEVDVTVRLGAEKMQQDLGGDGDVGVVRNPRWP